MTYVIISKKNSALQSIVAFELDCITEGEWQSLEKNPFMIILVKVSFRNEL